jgi:hypothetical protein
MRLYLVLPNANDAPTFFLKKAIDHTIPGSIHQDFAIPICAVSFGHPTMLFASVPKAPIYKNRKPSITEYEIGKSGKRLMSAPAFQPSSGQ